MGFNNEYAEPIVLDIETLASPEAAQWLDPVKAPANYKDETKIAAYCAEKFAERVATAALEADLCEVIAVGLLEPASESRPTVVTRADLNEAAMLALLWHRVGQRPIIGFNSLSFDLPVLIRRSQLLGVPYPSLNLDRYRTPHIDLLERLSFNGKLTYRSLGFYTRRFALDVPADPHRGADIAALVAAEDWPAIAAHCRADVLATAALATRLGWCQRVPETEAVL